MDIKSIKELEKKSDEEFLQALNLFDHQLIVKMAHGIAASYEQKQFFDQTKRSLRAAREIISDLIKELGNENPI